MQSIMFSVLFCYKYRKNKEHSVNIIDEKDVSLLFVNIYYLNSFDT
jgi:hypothetical protein